MGNLSFDHKSLIMREREIELNTRGNGAVRAMCRLEWVGGCCVGHDNVVLCFSLLFGTTGNISLCNAAEEVLTIE